MSGTFSARPFPVGPPQRDPPGDVVAAGRYSPGRHHALRRAVDGTDEAGRTVSARSARGGQASVVVVTGRSGVEAGVGAGAGAGAGEGSGTGVGSDAGSGEAVDTGCTVDSVPGVGPAPGVASSLTWAI